MSDEEARPQPLQGVKVIDLGQVYQGPYAAFLMAKAGAEVIKVEPVHGEPVRIREALGGSASLPMAMLNSNKRGITLNLKSPRGCQLLKALVSRSDVLIENYAPGVMNRLGVGAEVLLDLNPRLVYASATGYGLSGPERDGLAMDLTIQAASGIMSVTGLPDGPPLKAGPAVADFISGTHLYGAIMTALFERERTGRGRVVEVAMIETIYPTLASNLGMIQSNPGAPPPRTGNRHGGLAISPYNVYPCKDGHIAIICLIEVHWTNLLKAMGREELKDDPRFADNRARIAYMEETDAVVEEWTKNLTCSEIFEMSRVFRIPTAPVRNLVEVINSPHMHERGMLQWIDHYSLGRIVVPNSPLRYHGTSQMMGEPNPRLGEHNREIYGGVLGLSDSEIDALKADGVI
jgi:CoA:oxalate CoA-transferase